VRDTAGSTRFLPFFMLENPGLLDSIVDYVVLTEKLFCESRMKKTAAKAPAVPSLRAAAKQSSVSFLDCHGAKAPRNDGLPVRLRLPAF
jgi:hypothetical protein